MTDLAEAVASTWGAWIWAVTWQVSALVAVVWTADRVLRDRAWPRLRMALWSLVFVKLLLPPSLASPVSVTAVLLDGDAPASTATASVGAGGVIALLAAWVIGLLWTATRHRIRAVRQRRALLESSVPPPGAVQARVANAARRLGLRRVPAVVVCNSAGGAAVIGVHRPIMVLPPSLLDPERAEEADHVVLHELAHIRRRDPWTAMAVSALCALFWFHPLVALAARRVASLREVCCDETVGRVLGPERPRYRRTVLRAARDMIGTRGHVPALSMAPQAAALAERLRALESPACTRPALRATVTVLTVLLASVCVLPMAQTLADLDPFAVQARRTLDRVAAGTHDGGCLRVRYAALYLAASNQGTPR